MNTTIGKIQAWKSLVIGCGKLIACGSLVMINFANKASGDGPWDAYSNFSSTQGPVWYYQQRPHPSGSATNMTYTGLVYQTTDSGQTGWLGNYQGIAAGHPGNSIDVIRKWVAPSGGTVSITGRVYKIATDIGGAGIVANVEKNGTSIWCRTIAYNDAVGCTTDGDLGAVIVSSGDSLAFIVDDNGTYAADHFGWDPVITKTAIYDAYSDYTSIQGPVWYYQQRLQSGGAVTNMQFPGGGVTVYTTTDYPSGNYGWLGNYTGISTGHPGASLDVVRKWIAPSGGLVSVKGSVYKVNTSGGGGIVATVELNGTSKWSHTIAYNDAVGYSTDSSLSSVSVNSGNSIAFIVNDNGVFGADQFYWKPVINLISSSATLNSWALNTDDTLLTLAIIGNQLAITNLEDAATQYNWTPNPITVPLPTQVISGGTVYAPNWSYTSATTDTSSGTKVTLVFNSTSPSLTLTQCWWAHPGVGPVEESTSIANNTGGSVTYNDADIVAADLTVTADSTVTLWRFNRSSVGPGFGSPPTADSGFATSVFKDVLGVNSSIGTIVSNDYGINCSNNYTGFLLPFIMLDVNASHGLYMGYTCDFGTFSTTTRTNALQVRNLFSLWSSGNFSQNSGTTLSLPGMFVGTYKGDTDSGSNKMKKWFWNNKITPTIKSTTNEPLLSMSMAGGNDADTQADANLLFAANSLTSLGFEMCKEDYLWADDAHTHPNFGYDWNPNAAGWPNGMTLGSIAHNNGVKLSLYMGNRYNLVDLSTAVGVGSEETALQTRYNGTATNFVAPGFDYWRTDIDFEGVDDYLSHLGFMQVLDYMISNNSGFRWENCSGGGSKKSFDLLQRQSFMSTVDDSFPTIGFRQAYYSNVFMINPVQMQFTSFENSAVAGSTTYQHRNGFLGAWLLGVSDPFGVGEATLYKSKQRPILRGADVYHILQVCDGTHWDGFEFLNTSLATNPKGSVVLFKPNSSTTTSGTFYLKGLIPTTTYTLSYQDRTGSNTSMTGSALMTTGLTISGSANVYDSEIIWLSW